MLTLFEKVLFIAAVCASLYFGYVGFRKVYEVVMRGPGEKPTFRQMMGKLWHFLNQPLGGSSDPVANAASAASSVASAAGSDSCTR